MFTVEEKMICNRDGKLEGWSTLSPSLPVLCPSQEVGAQGGKCPRVSQLPVPWGGKVGGTVHRGDRQVPVGAAFQLAELRPPGLPLPTPQTACSDPG